MINLNIRNRTALAENTCAGIVHITKMETLKIAWNMNAMQVPGVSLKDINFFNCG